MRAASKTQLQTNLLLKPIFHPTHLHTDGRQQLTLSVSTGSFASPKALRLGGAELEAAAEAATVWWVGVRRLFKRRQERRSCGCAWLVV